MSAIFFYLFQLNPINRSLLQDVRCILLPNLTNIHNSVHFYIFFNTFNRFFLIPYAYGYYLVNLKRKKYLKHNFIKYNEILFNFISIYTIPSLIVNFIWTEFVLTAKLDLNIPLLIFYVLWTVIFTLIFYGSLKR